MKKIFLILLCFTLLAGNSVFAQSEATIDGHSAQEWLAEAEFQFFRGDYNRALNACINTLTLDNQADYAYFLRGASYARLGIHHQAINEFTTAIELNPNKEIYYVWRASALAQRYVYDEAVADFAKALAINPNDPYCYLQRGQAYYMQQQYENAITDFDKAITLAENNYLAHYYKAMASEELGLKQQALDNYKYFLNNAPPRVKQSYIKYAEDRVNDLSQQN